MHSSKNNFRWMKGWSFDQHMHTFSINIISRSNNSLSPNRIPKVLDRICSPSKNQILRWCLLGLSLNGSIVDSLHFVWWRGSVTAHGIELCMCKGMCHKMFHWGIRSSHVILSWLAHTTLVFVDCKVILYIMKYWQRYIQPRWVCI